MGTIGRVCDVGLEAVECLNAAEGGPFVERSSGTFGAGHLERVGRSRKIWAGAERRVDFSSGINALSELYVSTMRCWEGKPLFNAHDDVMPLKRRACSVSIKIRSEIGLIP